MQHDRIKSIYNEISGEKKVENKLENFSKCRRNKSVLVDLKNKKGGSDFDC